MVLLSETKTRRIARLVLILVLVAKAASEKAARLVVWLLSESTSGIILIRLSEKATRSASIVVVVPKACAGTEPSSASRPGVCAEGRWLGLLGLIVVIIAEQAS